MTFVKSHPKMTELLHETATILILYSWRSDGPSTICEMLAIRYPREKRNSESEAKLRARVHEQWLMEQRFHMDSAISSYNRESMKTSTEFSIRNWWFSTVVAFGNGFRNLSHPCWEKHPALASRRANCKRARASARLKYSRPEIYVSSIRSRAARVSNKC